MWLMQQGIMLTEGFTQITWVLSVLRFDNTNKDLHSTQSD